MTAPLINPQTERPGSSHTSMDPRGILKAFPKRKKIQANLSSKALAKIPKREDGEGTGGKWTQSQKPHMLEPSDFLHCSWPESDIRLELTLPAQGLQVALYLPCTRLGPHSLTGCLLCYLLPYSEISINQKIFPDSYGNDQQNPLLSRRLPEVESGKRIRYPYQIPRVI